MLKLISFTVVLDDTADTSAVQAKPITDTYIPGKDAESSGKLSDDKGQSNEEQWAAEQVAGFNTATSKVVENLLDIGSSLATLCSDTDPLFVQVGRELQAISAETKNLTGSMLETAHLVKGESGESGVLDTTAAMINQILDSLTTGRSSVANSHKNIRELIGRIMNCRRVNDAIDTINTRFKVVRVNMRIQCSTQLSNGEMFKSVTSDIDALSNRLQSITGQIKKDLAGAGKKLRALESSVARNLVQLENNSGEAKQIVSMAFTDIQKLMEATVNMIQEASRKSVNISEKTDEVIISIQFHDSLSQRASHIQHAVQDICSLLDSSKEDLTPERLGSAWLILDLQHRQLDHIIEEISSIHDRIQTAFLVMEEEVSGLTAIVHRSRVGISPQQAQRSLFTSLQDALFELCDILLESNSMLAQMRTSANKTKMVADKLMQLMEEIHGMREDTRLQAANTIIMASNLGQQGKTIQVLAKEISSMSDQAGDLTTDVEVMQLGIKHKVAELLETSDQNIDTVNIEKIEDITEEMGNAYHEIEQGIAEINKGIKMSSNHIGAVRSSLTFLSDLQERLFTIVDQIEDVKVLLDPWKDSAAKDGREMDQLIERYTMEQERMIHMFDRVDEGQKEQKSDEDIFF